MTKEQRTAMTRIISNTPPQQRCNANYTILPSSHGNVARLIHAAEKVLIFATIIVNNVE